MRGWWNQGTHLLCLSTYCFLVRCSIPARFSGLALVSSWQANINDMLRSIPTVSVMELNAYFDTIDAKLTMYENLLSEAPTLFPEQFGLVYGIVLNILSFLESSDENAKKKIAPDDTLTHTAGWDGHDDIFSWLDAIGKPKVTAQIKLEYRI